MEKEKEFRLQPSCEQREEWHDESSIGELSTVDGFEDLLNEDGSIEIELVESVAEIMERLDRGKTDLNFLKKSQVKRWT